jgi:hypothetical protein
MFVWIGGDEEKKTPIFLALDLDSPFTKLRKKKMRLKYDVNCKRVPGTAMQVCFYAKRIHCTCKEQV